MIKVPGGELPHPAEYRQAHIPTEASRRPGGQVVAYDGTENPRQGYREHHGSGPPDQADIA